jgi:hypothetical protein
MQRQKEKAAGLSGGLQRRNKKAPAVKPGPLAKTLFAFCY